MGKTSTEVKNRYNDKAYTAITLRLPKDLVAAFKDKCESTDVPQRQVILEAIEKFLEE